MGRVRTSARACSRPVRFALGAVVLLASLLVAVPQASAAASNTLKIQPVGGDGSTVTYSVGGVASGNTCAEFGNCSYSINQNATVKLSVNQAVSGWTLTSWASVPGATAPSCTETQPASTCTFTLSSDISVSPVFTTSPLNVTPTTWDEIGLDSNKPSTDGPDSFPVGAKVCNRGVTNYTGVTAQFVWDSANPYLSLAGGVGSASLGTLNAGTCLDAYFLVKISRVAAAYSTTRQYRIVFTTNDGTSQATPSGRRLVVNSLVSQNRNSIIAITGGSCTDNNNSATCAAAPTSLSVGGTYIFKLFGTTSSPHDVVTSFITFDPSIFRVMSVSATYATPAGATGSSPFGNACGFDQKPGTALYGSCAGPVGYVGGQLGGSSVLTYTVKVVGEGSAKLTGMFFDPSGGSFHYNSDYSSFVGVNVVSKFPLSATVSGNGAVSSADGGVSACRSNSGTCTGTYVDNTTVTLTASADANNAFVGWTGACSGTSTTCTVLMDEAKTVQALFAANDVVPPSLLGVVLGGAGTGSVTSSPSGISCSSAGGTCSASYTNGTTVTLTATPDVNMIFSGWSGDVSGASAGTCTATSTTCVVPMTASRTIHALFEVDPTLTVSVVGDSRGVVTSNIGGINCTTSGGSCVGNYALDASVTLTATTNGSTFTGWGGACSGTALTCTVTMNVEKTVTATFGTTIYPLSVTKSGAGTGSVTSNPAGISCGDTCAYGYSSGTSVTLTATADPGSTFTGWGGACSGTASTCTVTMSAIRSVTASFDLVYALTVTRAGTGSGAVTSSPAGITCGATCSTNYSVGTTVTLTATASVGSAFSGWSGGSCSGTSTTCTITMDQARYVTATFNLSYTLSLTQVGNGSVSSSPSGISSTGPGATSAAFDSGSVVTLTATADNGWRFNGWSGGVCSGTGTCVVTMNAAKGVTATFVRQYTLTTNQVGNGTIQAGGQTVVSTAGGTWSSVYDTGTSVSLSATASNGWRFSGWTGGGCSGTGSCSVTMSSDQTVTATFVQIFGLTVTQVGSGTVSSSPSGIASSAPGTTGPVSYDVNTSVTLTMAAASGWRLAGWTGDVAGAASGMCTASSATCVVSMSQARSITATFVQEFGLTVTQVGSGTVSSSPSGIASSAPGTTGPVSYDVNTSVTLTASPASGWDLAGWSGDVTGATAGTCTSTSAACVVPMTAARSITATFVLRHRLTVTQVGNGSVESSPAGMSLSAPGTTSSSFDDGTTVTLSAVPDTGWRFIGWTGDCTGTATCVVTMNAAQAVTATFDLVPAGLEALTVSVIGGGTVDSAVGGSVDGGIAACSGGSGTCSALYTTGSTVVLTATTPAGQRFAGWSDGECSDDAPTCTITMSSDKAITATFVELVELTVTQVGGGSVGSSPSGISLSGPGTSAPLVVDANALVTLTMSPASGWRLAGWSGDTSGAATNTCTATSATCEVSMSQARSITATFVRTFDLTVTQVGGGSVSSSPSGIWLLAPGSSGPLTLDVDTPVTLTMAAVSGWRLAGWSGDTSGAVADTCTSTSATCEVSMSQARSITATFVEVFTLSVGQTGDGSVSSSPSGVSTVADGESSTATFDVDTPVTLTMAAASGWRLAGWSGDTSGAATNTCTSTSATCELPMSQARSITATFVEVFTLSVTQVGSGTVSSSPSGVSTVADGESSTATFDGGISILLTATAADGWRFDGWTSGDCAGSTPTCTVLLDRSRVTTANFVAVDQFVLTQVGSGSVTSSPNVVSSIAAGDTTVGLDRGTSFSLTATPSAGWRFAGWSGEGCSGTDGCAVTVAGTAHVTATFVQLFDLSVHRTGPGSVTVDSAPITFANDDWIETVETGTVMTLVATADADARFVGWSGDCSGASTCIVTLSQGRSVTAVFVAVRELTVTKVGEGTVDLEGSSLVDPGPWTAQFDDGSTATLTAVPASGWTFTGWTQDCSGSSSCAVVMDGNAAVTATFVQIPTDRRSLTVTVTGGGAVGSTPSGITTCAESSGSCSALYEVGTSVVLTATAGPSTRFDAWSGCDSVSADGVQCTVAMSTDRSVTATFITLVQLTVTQVGSGTVDSSPSGISLSSAGQQSASFDLDRTVTLTATATSGWRRAGWTGDTSGATAGTCTSISATCVVPMSAARSITATFVRTHTLTVTSTGDGRVTTGGTDVLSAPGTWTATFDSGAWVSLGATADPGWVFAGWSGGCTGSSSCGVTLDDDVVVRAVFDPVPVNEQSLTVAVTGNGGAVNSSPAGIVACTSSTGACTTTAATGTTVTLTVVIDTNGRFDGWSRCDSVSVDGTTCTVTLSADRTVEARFHRMWTVQVTVLQPGRVDATIDRSATAITGCRPTGGANCTMEVVDGTSVRFHPEPDSGWVFLGWGGTLPAGVCTTRADCTVSVTSALALTADFAPTHRVSVSVSGTGTGEVNAFMVTEAVQSCDRTSAVCTADDGRKVTAQRVPAALVRTGLVGCRKDGGACTSVFDAGTRLVIVASTDPGSRFAGWDGACSGASDQCTITIDREIVVLARFDFIPVINATVVGSGGLRIDGTRVLDGSGNYTRSLDGPVYVRVSAEPDPGQEFAGWTGACEGTGECIVLVDRVVDVTAWFRPVATETTSTTDGTAPGLPATGTGDGPIGAAGLVLLGLGAGLAVLGRRRRQEQVAVVAPTPPVHSPTSTAQVALTAVGAIALTMLVGRRSRRR